MIQQPIRIIQLMLLGAACLLYSNMASGDDAWFVHLGEGVSVWDSARLEDGTALVVGNQFNSETSLQESKLFTIASDGSFTTTDLIGLGGDSYVFGISANGDYIAGQSQSQNAEAGDFEGTVWSRASNWSPMGIGFAKQPGKAHPLYRSSSALGISDNGVAIGRSDGVRAATTWSVDDGLQVLGGDNGLVSGWKISADGQHSVGLGTAPLGGDFSPYFWNGLEESILGLEYEGEEGLARGISDNSIFIGGEHAGIAYVWEDTDGVVDAEQNADDYSHRFLTNPDGTLAVGEVRAISDNGWAVGTVFSEDFTSHTMIWHESLGGVQLFDDWLLSEHGLDLPADNSSLDNIHFDGENLNFATGPSGYFVSVRLSSVPEPGSCAVLSVVLTLLALRRKK